MISSTTKQKKTFLAQVSMTNVGEFIKWWVEGFKNQNFKKCVCTKYLYKYRHFIKRLNIFEKASSGDEIFLKSLFFPSQNLIFINYKQNQKKSHSSLERPSNRLLKRYMKLIACHCFKNENVVFCSTVLLNKTLFHILYNAFQGPKNALLL